MNKFMVIMGLLLIVGLSFAGRANWMGYVEGRYYCNWIYTYGQYTFADTLYDEGADCDLDSMESDLDSSRTYVNIMDNYACVDPDTSLFRSSMLGYNLKAAHFRGLFNQCVGSYLSEGGDRQSVIDILRIIRGAYMGCVEAGIPCQTFMEPPDTG